MDKNDQVKLKFFNALLEINPQIRGQYEGYLSTQNGNNTEIISKKEAVDLIQEFTTYFKEEFDEIDVDEPDWENYIPRHSGYIEHYDAVAHMAEETIDEVFERMDFDIRAMIRNGEIPTALLKLTALYDACLNANIKDTYGVFPDSSDYLINKWSEFLKIIILQLRMQVLADSLVEWYLNILFTHFSQHHLDNEQYLTSVEPLLLELVNSEPLAIKTEQLLGKFQIEKKQLARLIPNLAKLNNDWGEWAKEAEQLMIYNAEVAMDLLKHYIEKSEDDFIRIANKLWRKNLYKSQTADLYFKHLDPKKVPELYKEVVKYLIQYNQTKEYYGILQGLFTEYEKEQFLEKYKYSGKFYAMMLHMEGRHEQLLDYLRKDKYPIDFIKMIPYLYDSHPAESLKLIKEYILYRLSDRKYRRREYPQIVELLLSTQKIKGHDQEINTLIRIVYNYQPYLPALRKKMDDGGLVNEKK